MINGDDDDDDDDDDGDDDDDDDDDVEVADPQGEVWRDSMPHLRPCNDGRCSGFNI